VTRIAEERENGERVRDLETTTAPGRETWPAAAPDRRGRRHREGKPAGSGDDRSESFKSYIGYPETARITEIEGKE
jgi:hypothetical protein